MTDPTSSSPTGSASEPASEPVSSTPPTPPTSGVVPSPTATTADAAGAEAATLAELQQRRSTALASTALDERWVAQLASKAVGTTDPLQTAANGTHTFYAADILDEVDSLSARVGGDTLLLASTDFGKRSTAPDGSPYWVLLDDSGFASADAVRSWCASTFSELASEQLANACAPRRLTPPR